MNAQVSSRIGWQAGFRAQRGCRDNILLLRVLYDQVINANSKCAVTYIDFSAAFDTVSHKFMDSTLAKAGASRKSRAIFRAIYAAASGIARVNGTDGKYVYSGAFNVGRGVIQGDIISPVLFILALDALGKRNISSSVTSAPEDSRQTETCRFTDAAVSIIIILHKKFLKLSKCWEHSATWTIAGY